MALAIGQTAVAQIVTCNNGANEYHVQWPESGTPVWEMCFLTPESSSAPDGSGLELRYVHYNGIKVFDRAHSPMLFADYSSGLCYRDWKDTNSNFLADNEVINEVMAAPMGDVETTCDLSLDPDIPVGDCPYGTAGQCFDGVAVEWNAGELILTTQYSAAWYKYGSRAYFYANGEIDFEFGFGNSNGTNSHITHWHHNYWRMDFDIDGTSDNDQVFLNDTLQTVEFADIRDETGGPGGAPVTWSVIDSDTGRGYRINPGANDYLVPHDDSGHGQHPVDLMATQYHAGEYGDRSDNPLGACDMNEANLIDGESLVGEDVVMYYMAGVKDITGVDMMICKKAGPLLEPIGFWGPIADLIFESSFD